MRGVGPYRRYCDEHFPCLEWRPGGWAGAGLAVPFGCGRPCDHQRQAPAVQVGRECESAPDPVHRHSAGHSQLRRRDVSPQCKLRRRPVRSHRCSSWTRLMTPVVVQRLVPGRDTAENCGGSAVAVLTRWSMSLLCSSSTAWTSL